MYGVNQDLKFQLWLYYYLVRFLGTLKNELVYYQRYKTRGQAIREIVVLVMFVKPCFYSQNNLFSINPACRNLNDSI